MFFPLMILTRQGAKMSYMTRAKKRMEKRRAAGRIANLRLSLVILLDADRVIEECQAAYVALGHPSPRIVYKRGWYQMHGKNYRRGDIVKITGLLQARAHEVEIGDGE